jgi:ABC-2 type transport system permease protein
VRYSQAEAESLYEQGEIERLLTLPAGFSEDLAAGVPVTIHLISASTNTDENNSVGLVIEGVARDMSLKQQILASLEQIGQMQGASPADQQVFTAERNVAQAQSQFDSSQERPLIKVQQQLPATLGEEATQNISAVQLAVPGATVLFVFLTAQTTASALYEEKKHGSFRRLLAAPISKAALLEGKMLPNFVIVIMQVVFIFAVAIVIFPLIGMDQLSLGEDPLALTLLVLVMALCSTCLGILIAAVARTEAQIGGVSQAFLWVAGFIGGAIVPFFLLNDTMANIGKITPQYWAVTGFNEIMVLGGDLASITLNLVALLIFSILFFAVGLWRFDYN